MCSRFLTLTAMTPSRGASTVPMQSPTWRPAASAIPPGSTLLTASTVAVPVSPKPKEPGVSTTVIPKDWPGCVRTSLARTCKGSAAAAASTLTPLTTTGEAETGASPRASRCRASLPWRGEALEEAAAEAIEPIDAASHGAIAMRSRSFSIMRHVRCCPSPPEDSAPAAAAAAAAAAVPPLGPPSSPEGSARGCSSAAPMPPPELLRRWKIFATSVLRRLSSALAPPPAPPPAPPVAAPPAAADARSVPRSKAVRGLAGRREGEELSSSSES